MASVIAVTDDTGAVLNSFSYGLFGENSSLTGTPFGYTGQRYDPEIGAYYYKARYYVPSIGRFLQADPIGFAACEMNFYSYVGNDPVNTVDSLGLQGKGPDMMSNLINTAQNIAPRGLTADVGGTLFAGAGYGLAETGNFGGGVFLGPGLSVNSGSYLSGGAMYGGPFGGWSAAPQVPSAIIPGSRSGAEGGILPNSYSPGTSIGAYGGAGVNLGFTNATDVSKLYGPFNTVSFGAALGRGASLNVSWEGQ